MDRSPRDPTSDRIWNSSTVRVRLRETSPSLWSRALTSSPCALTRLDSGVTPGFVISPSRELHGRRTGRPLLPVWTCRSRTPIPSPSLQRRRPSPSSLLSTAPRLRTPHPLCPAPPRWRGRGGARRRHRRLHRNRHGLGRVVLHAFSAALADGAHLANANIAGSTALSNTNAFLVDTAVPVAPVVLKPADGSTTGPTPLLSGTAEAGARVTVSLDGAAACVTSADATGAWSCTSGTALAAGTHTVSATSTDGPATPRRPPPPTPSRWSSACPPSPALTSPADGSSTSSTTPAFTGTAAAGSTVTVTVDGATACTATATSAGTFTCTPCRRARRRRARRARLGEQRQRQLAHQRARRASPSTPRAPLTPVVVGPANGSHTSSTTPTVTGTGEPGSTVTVRLDGTAGGHRHRPRRRHLELRPPATALSLGDAHRLRDRHRRGGQRLAALGHQHLHRRLAPPARRW